jgi:hypothetical protein
VLATSVAAIALPAGASAHDGARRERIHHHRHHHHARFVRFASGSSVTTTTTAPTNPPTSPAGEAVGTIASFEGGVLKITLSDGTTVSGMVTEATRIDCSCPMAMVSDHGGGGPGPSSSSGRDGQDHDQGDDGDDHGDQHQGQECTKESLLAGAKVREAELKLSGGQAIWESIELAH